MNEALQRFERKFLSLRFILPLLALFPAWYLFIQKDMVFPPTDLMVYRRAADFIAVGNSPYSAEFTTNGFEALPWVYTPFASLLIMPLHHIPVGALLPLWTVIGIAIPLIVLVAVSYHAVWASGRYTRGEKFALLGIFTVIGALVGAVVDTYALGQVGVLLSALALFDMAAPDRWFARKWMPPRGVLAGIAGAIKLIPLVVIPYWIITKQWRTAASATATVAVTWGLAFLVFPQDSITYFTERKFMASNNPDWIRLADNQSLIAGIQRAVDVYPLPNHIWMPIAAIIVALGLLVARATYRNGDALAAGVIVGLTSALASPVSWVHHYGWLVAVPGAILAGRAFRTDDGRVTKAGWTWLLVATALAIPAARHSWSPFHMLEWAEHYNLVSIAVIVWLWARSRRQVTDAH